MYNLKGRFFNMKTAFYVEYEGGQVEQAEIVAKIKQKWVDDGKLIKEIKTLDLYAKPEDNSCYYLINGDIQGKVDLF